VHSFPPVVAELRRCAWTDAGELRLDGWSYLLDAQLRAPRIRVYGRVDGLDPIWEARVERRRDLEVNAFSTPTEDLSQTAWTAFFEGKALQTALRKMRPSKRPDAGGLDFRVWVELDFGKFVQRGPFTMIYCWGSAGSVGGRALNGNSWVWPQWRTDHGLVLSVHRAGVFAEAVEYAHERLSVRLLSMRVGGQASRVSLVPGSAEATLDSSRRIQTIQIRPVELPAKEEAALVWTSSNGSRHPVLGGLPALTLGGHPAVGLQVACDGVGGLRIKRAVRAVQIEDVQLDGKSEPILRLSGTVAGEWTGPLLIELRGPRDRLVATAELTGGAFEAAVAMVRTNAWGHDGLAPTPGGYRLWVRDAAGSEELGRLSSRLLGKLYRWEFTDKFSARLENHPDGGLWVVISDPRLLAEIGPFARRKLRARYQGPREIEVENAIYFESFVGKFCACNPRAVFDELTHRDTGLKFYWGVKDLSVPTPEGATAVTINSAEWWRVRHAARYLVTNDWLHDTFQHRPHQRVLQTWHGTALKLLALDRLRARENQSFARSVEAESARWDVLLAENPYSVDVMRRAYDYPGLILESGYPRNDILISDAGVAMRERIRVMLGVRPDQQVVLYAPTWREDRTSMVNDLDLARLAQALGDGFVVLARGHANTLRNNAELSLDGVIDVTSYPEASDIFCASDICLTDYSSVMFDFTVTGKPLLFFTPDYERYINDLRGVYFDLREVAPGPLLTSLEDTVSAIASSMEVRRKWSERYSAWVERFNVWDDGKAAVRAVDALLSS
jgi:CDP-glycerol glycerophosphotransferase